MYYFKKTAIPTFGYLIVAAFSLISGTALSIFNGNVGILDSDEIPTLIGTVSVALTTMSERFSENTFFNIYFFFITLILFFVVRHILLDLEESEYSNKAKRAETVKIADLAVFGIGIAFLTHVAAQISHQDRAGIVSELFLSLAVSLPFVVWIVTTRRLLASGVKTVRHDAYNFANRVFYPSLFSCTVCFLYGWALLQNGDSNGTLVIFLYSVLLTTLYLVTVQYTKVGGRGPSARLAIFVLIGLVFALPLLTRLLIPWDVFNTIAFATVVAFALGVSDVAQRVHTHAKQNRLRPESEATSYYEAGANWSAFVLVPSVPILGFLNTNIPVWFLAIYSGIYLFTWMIFANKESSIFSWICIILGLALPVWLFVALCIGATFPDYVTVAAYTDLSAAVSLLGLPYALMGLMGLFFGLHSDLRKLANNNLAFIDVRNALLLFIGVAIAVMFVTSLTYPLLHLLGPDQVLLEKKMVEIQYFITILAAIALVFYILPLIGGRGDKSRKSTAQSPVSDTNSTSRQSILSLVIMGRPTISCIAGFGVVLVSISQPEAPLQTAIVGGFAIALITMFGFVVNDIFDLNKDMLGARTDKRLVNGSASELGAKYYAVILLGAALICSWLAAGWAGLSLVLPLGLALSFYSKFSENVPYAKGLYTAILCMAPLPMAEAILGTSFVSPSIYLFGILYFSGRELLFDVVDFDADQSAGVRTLAIIIGRRASVPVSWLAMATAMVLLYPIVSDFGKLILAVNLVILAGVAYIGISRLLLSSNLTRINLVLGLGAVADALA